MDNLGETREFLKISSNDNPRPPPAWNQKNQKNQKNLVSKEQRNY